MRRRLFTVLEFRPGAVRELLGHLDHTVLEVDAIPLKAGESQLSPSRPRSG